MHKNIFQNKIGKAFAVVAVAGMILSGNGMPWMAADAYAAVDLAQIPEYTGSPYTVINDNEPEFEADDFSTEAFENYSELDDLGRCGVAYARRLCRLRSAARLVWLSRPDGIPLNIRSLLRIDICTTDVISLGSSSPVKTQIQKT